MIRLPQALYNLRKASLSSLEPFIGADKGEIRFGYCVQWSHARNTGVIQDAETKIEYPTRGADLYMPEECRNPGESPRAISSMPPFLKYPKDRFLNVGEPLEFEILNTEEQPRAYRVTGCGGSPLLGKAFEKEMAKRGKVPRPAS